MMLLILCSCIEADKENFYPRSLDSSDKIVRHLWGDSAENVQLYMMYVDLGGMGYYNWINLQKVVDKDTINYGLGISSGYVEDDTLIIFEPGPNGGVSGWWQMHSKGRTRAEYTNDLDISLDSILATDTTGLWEGFYKFEDGSLTKISN